MTLAGRTAIVGVGTTAYGARGEFAHRGHVEMIGEALDRALEDCGLEREEIEIGIAGELVWKEARPAVVLPRFGRGQIRER